MQDCQNEPPTLHSLSRKRKADTDDHQAPDHPSQPDPVDSLLLDTAATPRIPTDAPEVHTSSTWLLAHHPPQIWQPTAPAASTSTAAAAAAPTFVSAASQEGPSRPKRPRIEIPQSLPSSPRKLRRGRVLYSGNLSSPRRFARHPRAVFSADPDVVSAIEARKCSPPSPKHVSQSLPVSPIEPPAPSYHHIPPHQPPINRETLKELDLEAILRNPQLRHDLLFDPGLQFRPTFSLRKRNMAESYWVAVIRELETGCTCTTLDANGKPIERRCVCSSVPMPADKLVRAFPAQGNFTTVRAPSRVRPLLAELREVLVSIIQPAVEPRPSTALGLHPGLLHPQYHQNVPHVSYLRSILDVDLIQQEVGHGLFDPSGVFQAIGDIIRCYCAPMRDHAVDQMVNLAKSCAPGGSGTKADAVRAIRLCFEIMELMKLDVANHQLQTLRPYLVHSAAQFELKMFQENRQKSAKGPQALTLDVTRHWLQAAYDELAAQNAGPQLSLSMQSKSLLNAFTKYPRIVQIQTAVTRAIVNLIFDPPTTSINSPVPSPPSSPYPSSPSTASRQGYPETLYLDSLRLNTLRNDAADFTALYMLLMLYRQLIHSGSGLSTAQKSVASTLSTDDLLVLKKEIWEIGPARLGHCFVRGGSSSSSSGDNQDKLENETSKWRDGISDVVLQLAVRAGDARSRTIASIIPKNQPQPSTSASSSSSSSGSSPSPKRSLPARTPDASLLKLATSWTGSNLRADSPLSVLMKKRIKRVVEELVLQRVVPASPTPATSTQSTSKKPDTQSSTPTVPDVANGLGLEPLMPEIRHLSERLSKLVSIHMNVYGALYAQPGFLIDLSHSSHPQATRLPSSDTHAPSACARSTGFVSAATSSVPPTTTASPSLR